MPIEIVMWVMESKDVWERWLSRESRLKPEKRAVIGAWAGQGDERDRVTWISWTEGRMSCPRRPGTTDAETCSTRREMEMNVRWVRCL